MRKLWIGLAMAGLMVASAAAGAMAATGTRKQIEVEYKNIKISVDGNQVDTSDAEPFLYVAQGRNYVPARALAEALGAKVDWDANTNTVLVYTENYLKTTTDGEYKVWSSPADGFTIRVPRGFLRADMPTSILQLVLPDATGNLNAVVAVGKADLPQDGTSLTDKANALVYGLSQTFLPGATVTRTTADASQVTLEGTTVLMGGQVPATFTLRLVTSAKGSFIILTITPTAMGSPLQPVMTDIINSFTLQ
jgi:hypothetical protein